MALSFSPHRSNCSRSQVVFPHPGGPTVRYSLIAAGRADSRFSSLAIGSPVLSNYVSASTRPPPVRCHRRRWVPPSVALVSRESPISAAKRRCSHGPSADSVTQAPNMAASS